MTIVVCTLDPDQNCAQAQNDQEDCLAYTDLNNQICNTLSKEHNLAQKAQWGLGLQRAHT